MSEPRSPELPMFQARCPQNAEPKTYTRTQSRPLFPFLGLGSVIKLDMFTPQFTDYRPTISPITILTTAPHHHHTNIPLPPSYHHTILPPHLITIIPTYPYHHLTIIPHNHSPQLSYTPNIQKPQSNNLECGGRFTNCHKQEHLRSKKHQDYLQNIRAS